MHTEAPLITTIIPTYKRPKLLKRAINSVLNQTYTNFKIYVCDNASGDETQSIVLDFAKDDPRIKYYCHPSNIGPLENANYGLKFVDTPFFSILCDDDLLLPDFYQSSLDRLRKYPDARFSISSALNVKDNKILNDSLITWHKEGYYSYPDSFLEMVQKFPPIWTGILFRKDVLSNIGGFDLEVGLTLDNDYILRAAAKYPYVINKTPSAIYSIHPGSISVTENNYHMVWPGYIKTLINLLNFTDLPLEYRFKAKQIMTKHIKNKLLVYGINSIKNNNRAAMLEIASLLNNYYGMDIMAKVCVFLLYASTNYYPAHYFIDKALRLRDMLKRDNYRNERRRYRSYLKYLELYSQ